MNQKYIAVAVIVFIAWYSWFFRYDLSSGNGLTLDRWTGTIIPFNGNAHDLSETETAEQELARMLSKPESYLSTAREAGFSDKSILEAWAKENPRFNLDAARADGHDDTTMLEELNKTRFKPSN